MKIDTYFDLLEKGDFKQAEAYRQKDIPNKLIKFIWLDGDDTLNDKKKIASLENKTIWFSHISKVNDPYEFKGIILDKEKFRKAGYSEEVISNFEKQFSFEEYGIVCLSANAVDYLPMWAYYTNNHQGYCVEYDVIKKDCIHEVFYEPMRYPVASLIFQFRDALAEAMRLGKTRTKKTEIIGRIFFQNFFIKSDRWGHEAEYRIVYPIKNKKGQNVKVSNLGLRTSRIIAGINCSEDTIKKLNEISMKIGCGTAYRTCISETEYTLVEKRLPSDYLPDSTKKRWWDKLISRMTRKKLPQSPLGAPVR